MPQLLLEILSEEIPARMQAKAEADLVKALMDGLTAAGLIPEGIKGFSGPRRLVAVVEGLPIKSADVSEDIQGPKEGAPQPAIDGFLRKAGLKSIAEAHIHDVPKKGRIYIAHVRKPGRETAKLIAELVPAIIRGFHWPKSMRWGSGDLRWVRPISRILCTFDGEVVPFEIEGIKSDAWTEGHRVLGRGPFKVRRFDDYEEVLRTKGKIVLDREQRKETILSEARTLCAAQNLELVEDLGLLEEVSGLAEHPVVIIGDMDKAFLDLPPEVIRLSMRTHQKYFAVRDPAKKDGGLAPKFIVVANLTASDGGSKIAAGNSRVLSARLNDARFFWDNDRFYPPDRRGHREPKLLNAAERVKRLDEIVFHERLGSVGRKVKRVAEIGKRLAPKIPVSASLAEHAAMLAKCDLVSDMVGEFPELEGVMGRYYAKQQDELPKVADAIRDHYKPRGPADEIPTEPVAVVLALADKLDSLLGFWTIDEKPTGSKDPFALRRSALGVIRILLHNQVRIRLVVDLVFGLRLAVLARNVAEQQRLSRATAKDNAQNAVRLRELAAEAMDLKRRFDGMLPAESDEAPVLQDLLAFFADRLKVHLREQGARHDLIDAVFALGEDDLVLIVKRVEALGAFLDTEDGKNLLAGSKRAANILKAEEKKDGEGAFAADPDPKLFNLPEEKALHAALAKAAPAAREAVAKEDFAAAMRALAALRGPVDAFFDKVTVNAEEKDLRANRLRLLAQIRASLGTVADFSKIEGERASRPILRRAAAGAACSG